MLHSLLHSVILITSRVSVSAVSSNRAAFTCMRVIPYSGTFLQEKFSRMREIEDFANQCYESVLLAYLCQQKTSHSRIIFSRIACNSQKFSPTKNFPLYVSLAVC